MEDGRVAGVEMNIGAQYLSSAVIITTGTFLKGLIHIGLSHFPSGRAGEFPSVGLSDNLRELGFELGRLKTGTPARLNGKTIDFENMQIQPGDDPAPFFSFTEDHHPLPQLPCFLTYTNPLTHEIIRNNLNQSPLYAGIIKGIGPRYCPSIEDKVMRFTGRDRHQVFLEPEGLETKEYYANGIPTSLPYDVQVKFVRTIPGLEESEIMRPGYAIEYDFVFPTQLKHNLETKSIDGLFLAGQINGTSGYEEAAAQGFMAGINASQKLHGKEPLILGRHEAYIGVLIDDLITKGTNEPYRMFTSRAEYRLLLRHDNADLRLMDKGYEIGLLDKDVYQRFLEKKRLIDKELQRLKKRRFKLDENKSESLEQLLKRPEITYKFIDEVLPSDEPLNDEIKRQIEIQVKYEGYIIRQMEIAKRLQKIEKKRIPEDFNYVTVNGLSKEVLSKLQEVRPTNLGQASRIPGITPVAISLLMVAIERLKRECGNKRVT